MEKMGFGLACILIVQSVYALSDDHCREKSLWNEVHEYTEVSSIDKAFTQGKVEGQIRLAYINQDNHADDDKSDPSTLDNYATSIGGQLKYETAKLHHVSLAVSTFVSAKINDLSGDRDEGELNPDFFDEEGKSFAYLGEAYIDYAQGHLAIRLGRQKLDTPLNDRDDIRMLPNTFEALMAGYGGIENFVFVAGYINRWAGYDSGADISEFKDMPGTIDATGEHGKGVILAGVMNESLENIALQAWYYDFDKLAGVVYLDGIYSADYESGLFVEAGMQFGSYKEKSSSSIDGDVYGAKLDMAYGSFSLGASVNKVDTSEGEATILGYGGGPYFTSMEEMTIGSLNDVDAHVFSGGVDFSRLFEGLSLYYAYGKFNGKDSQANAVKYEENDIVLSYTFAENADIEASYAYVDDKSNSGSEDTGYDRVLVRANYNF